MSEPVRPPSICTDSTHTYSGPLCFICYHALLAGDMTVDYRGWRVHPKCGSEMYKREGGKIEIRSYEHSRIYEAISGFFFLMPDRLKLDMNNTEIAAGIMKKLQEGSMLSFELAKVGYEAYRAHTGGISLVSKKPIPPFEQLDMAIQEAWRVAADCIATKVGKDKADSGKEGM